MSGPVSSSAAAGIEPDGDLELRMTRREFGVRLGRALIASGGAYVARPAVRDVLMHVGYGGTGHGVVPALARRIYRFWSWGKRWPR